MLDFVPVPKSFELYESFVQKSFRSTHALSQRSKDSTSAAKGQRSWSLPSTYPRLLSWHFKVNVPVCPAVTGAFTFPSSVFTSSEGVSNLDLAQCCSLLVLTIIKVSRNPRQPVSVPPSSG